MNRNTVLYILAIVGMLTLSGLLAIKAFGPVPVALTSSSAPGALPAPIANTSPLSAPPQPAASATTPPAGSLLTGSSAADIDVPHSLAMDADGNLVVDEGVRELMDFFLALTGERSKDDIRALFLAAAQAQCSAICATQALSIYDRYMQYINAMQSESIAVRETDDLNARLERVHTLRMAILGLDLEQALFGYEDNYDQLRVAQWAIHNDSSLSAAEKQQALAELELNQPRPLTQREQQTKVPQSLHQLSQQFATNGTDPDTRLRAYSEIAGPEAAERLVQLEQSRHQWDQRYQQYRTELNSLKSTGLAPVDQQDEVTRLRLRYFSEQESMRVAALDRIREEVR